VAHFSITSSYTQETASRRWISKKKKAADKSPTGYGGRRRAGLKNKKAWRQRTGSWWWWTWPPPAVLTVRMGVQEGLQAAADLLTEAAPVWQGGCARWTISQWSNHPW
jgi:hypothetical protein